MEPTPQLLDPQEKTSQQQQVNKKLLSWRRHFNRDRAIQGGESTKELKIELPAEVVTDASQFECAMHKIDDQLRPMNVSIYSIECEIKDDKATFTVKY